MTSVVTPGAESPTRLVFVSIEKRKGGTSVLPLGTESKVGRSASPKKHSANVPAGRTFLRVRLVGPGISRVRDRWGERLPGNRFFSLESSAHVGLLDYGLKSASKTTCSIFL